MVDPKLMSSIRIREKSRLRSATKQKVEVVSTIMIYVCMGEARVRVLLGTVRNLAISTLFQTSFISKFVKDNFTAERKIVQAICIRYKRLWYTRAWSIIE